MSTAKKQIIKGFTFSWLRIVSGTFIPLIQTPFIFGYLDSERVGVWFVFFSIAFFIQLTDLGLSAALTRTISYIHSTDKSNFSEDSSAIQVKNFRIDTTIISSFIITIGLCAFIFTIANVYASVMKPDFGLQNGTEARNAFLIFTAGVALHCMSITALSVLNGFGDVGLDNLCRTIGQIVNFMTILIFLPVYKSIATLSVAYVLQSSTIFILSCLILFSKYSSLFSRKISFSFEIIKYLLKTGFPNFISQIGTWLIFQSNIFIASSLFGNTITANYCALRQLCMFGLSTIMMIPSVISPFASSFYATNQKENFKTLYYFSLKTATFFIILWCTGVFIWGESALRLWIGPGHFLGYSIMVPLLVSYILEVHHSINATFVWSSGIWPFATTTIISGILNLIFVYIFSKTIGIIGLALGTMLAQLVTNNWYAVYVHLKRNSIQFMEYLFKLIIPFLTFLFALGTVAWLTKSLLEFQAISGFSFRHLSAQEIISLFVGSGTVCIISVIIFYIFLLNKNERKYILTLSRKRNKPV